MKSRKSCCETFRSITGFALIGPGLFLLFAHFSGAVARLSQTLDHAASAGLEVVILASSWSPNCLAYDMAAMLWPALLVVLGIGLLNRACGADIDSKSRDCDPCMDCA